MDRIYPLKSNPGVQRDGTTFSGDNYIDAQWCRWYRGLPRKMGGYKRVSTLGDGSLVRALYVAPKSPNFNVYFGAAEVLGVLTLNAAGEQLGEPFSRTPTTYIPNPQNLWSFDRMFSTTDNGSVLLAHAPPSLDRIDEPAVTPIWYGELFGTEPLIDTGIDASGGMCVLHPYMFFFSNDGEIGYTAANNPTEIANISRVSSEKFIAMAPTRGGNSSPAGLAWSLNSVVRITEAGTNTINFKYDTISDDSSLISSKAVVEYDGRFYWPGIDRFLIYTGIVQELPNSLSLEYFFSHIDFTNRQKVWGTKIPKWGEIWWHFPDSTLDGYNGECNNAIIYNIREKTWYTTQVSRASGFFDPTFGYPLWADNVLRQGRLDSERDSTFWHLTGNTKAQYGLWQQEKDVDENIDGDLHIIPSWFESRVMSETDISPSGEATNVDRSIDMQRFEPDFIQTGKMFLIINGREYANSEIQSSSIFCPQMQPPLPEGVPCVQLTTPIISELGEFVFYPRSDEVGAPAATLKVDVRQQRRLLTVKCLSAEVGGDYQMGNPLIHTRIGDKRPA